MLYTAAYYGDLAETLEDRVGESMAVIPDAGDDADGQEEEAEGDGSGDDFLEGSPDVEVGD